MHSAQEVKDLPNIKSTSIKETVVETEAEAKARNIKKAVLDARDAILKVQADSSELYLGDDGMIKTKTEVCSRKSTNVDAVVAEVSANVDTNADVVTAEVDTNVDTNADTDIDTNADTNVDTNVDVIAEVDSSVETNVDVTAEVDSSVETNANVVTEELDNSSEMNADVTTEELDNSSDTNSNVVTEEVGSSVCTSLETNNVVEVCTKSSSDLDSSDEGIAEDTTNFSIYDHFTCTILEIEHAAIIIAQRAELVARYIEDLGVDPGEVPSPYGDNYPTGTGTDTMRGCKLLLQIELDRRDEVVSLIDTYYQLIVGYSEDAVTPRGHLKMVLENYRLHLVNLKIFLEYYESIRTPQFDSYYINYNKAYYFIKDFHAFLATQTITPCNSSTTDNVCPVTPVMEDVTVDPVLMETVVEDVNADPIAVETEAAHVEVILTETEIEIESDEVEPSSIEIDIEPSPTESVIEYDEVEYDEVESSSTETEIDDNKVEPSFI